MPFLVAPLAGLLGGGLAAQLLVGTALYVGGTLLSQALAPKPAAQKDPGVELSVRLGGDSPLSFIVGLGATAGHRTYAGTWGQDGETPNAFFVDVLEIANAPVDGYEGVRVDGEPGTILWDEVHADYGYPIAQGRKDGKDHLWVKFHDGRQTVADPYLRAKFGDHPDRPYDADMVGYGTAYAIVTTRYNRELWQGATPALLFEVRGLRCYDLRKDSTAGGSGTHRRNDPSTWEWTENPYVIAYNAAFMGVYVGDEWLWGLQNLPALRLPTSAWIAAMNEADRTLPAWDNQRQFVIGGEVTVDMEPAGFLEEVAKSSAGRWIESAGSYKPRCGAPGASIFAFTTDDLLVTDPRTITPFPGLEQTHNTVEISYTEPAEAWRPNAAPVQSKAEYVAADGNRKLVASLSLPFVRFNEQAQRLGFTYLEDGRRFRQLQASFHPISWLFEPGDVIDGTILSEGYNGKAFEILEMSGRRTFVQTITLREIDPGDFDPPSSARQPWSAGTIKTIYPPAQVVTGWAVSPYEHVDAQSRARRPGIQCFYQGAMDDIRAIKIMIRHPGETVSFFSQEYPYDATTITASVIIVGDFLLPNQPYQVASVFVPFSGRDMEESDWLPVTTPDVRLGPLDIYELDLENLNQSLNEAFADLFGNAREILAQAQALATSTADEVLANYADHQQIRRSLSSVYGDITSEYLEAITVATGPGSAIAGRVEALEVKVNTDIASAVQLLQAGIGTVDGKATANANAITALTSTVSDVASSVTVRGVSTSGPGGGWAAWGVEVKVGASPDDWSSGAFLIETNGSQSRAVFDVDQFILRSGSNREAPFVFEDGVAKMMAARVGTITAGILQGQNVTINLNTGFFSFG